MMPRKRIGHKKISYPVAVAIKEYIAVHDIRYVDELWDTLAYDPDWRSITFTPSDVSKFISIHEACGYISTDGFICLVRTRHLCKRFSTIIKDYGIW